MLPLFSTIYILATYARSVRADVGGAMGTPVGFASNVVGGGNATPQTPASIDELIKWLGDKVPRVITIDKEYNFIGSMGTCTNCPGCIPKAPKQCGSAGQNAIDIPGNKWCDPYPKTPVTYDKAGISGITVSAHKSLIGIGDSAVIRGRGLRMANGVSNIIIQNIHFTDTNPCLIWGGDAISVDGSDLIWIDHCKFSLFGRQMFVAGLKESGNITLSFNEFDGRTNCSHTCDGRHYWTILGYGNNDHVTLYGNYIHHTSGRSPRLEYNSVWHAVSNYWYSNTGHAFDVAAGSSAFVEGNSFEDVTKPMLPEPLNGSGQLFIPTNSTARITCSSYLGRACQRNLLVASGSLSGSEEGFLKEVRGYNIVPAHQGSETKDWVLKNAGIGKTRRK